MLLTSRGADFRTRRNSADALGSLSVHITPVFVADTLPAAPIGDSLCRLRVGGLARNAVQGAENGHCVGVSADHLGDGDTAKALPDESAAPEIISLLMLDVSQEQTEQSLAWKIPQSSHEKPAGHRVFTHCKMNRAAQDQGVIDTQRPAVAYHSVQEQLELSEGNIQETDLSRVLHTDTAQEHER